MSGSQGRREAAPALPVAPTTTLRATRLPAAAARRESRGVIRRLDRSHRQPNHDLSIIAAEHAYPVAVEESPGETRAGQRPNTPGNIASIRTGSMTAAVPIYPQASRRYACAATRGAALKPQEFQRTINRANYAREVQSN
jgi:hypothetical protein